jgi:hypothetical protein
MERTREPENQRANIDYRTDIDNLIARMARNSKTGIWKRNRRRAPTTRRIPQTSSPSSTMNGENSTFAPCVQQVIYPESNAISWTHAWCARRSVRLSSMKSFGSPPHGMIMTPP